MNFATHYSSNHIRRKGESTIMSTYFSPKIAKILERSNYEATRLYSRSIGPEHLMLGILGDQNNSICTALNRMNVNLQSMKIEIEQSIREEGMFENVHADKIVLNENANNVLRLAVQEARKQNRQVVDEEHLMLALLNEDMETKAQKVLGNNHVSYESYKEYLQTHPNKVQNSFDDNIDNDDDILMDDMDSDKKSAATAQQTQRKNSKTPVLDNFSVDMTKAAAEGKLDPVVGRDREIMRITEILCRRKKNNPVLIGEPGVGKSAIVEGLAQMIADKRTSPVLFNKRLLNLDMSLIVAGTKYRGQFEERLKALLKELEENPDVIVFIDEIHTMIGAGSAPGGMDAANMMKPALARGQIQCIGATTLDEYRKSIEKDGALERRFQKVVVEQTSAEETLEILHNIAPRYEEHHRVRYSEEAMRACVTYTERYISDRQFPDKAIDALDEVGSKVHLKHTDLPDDIVELQEQLKTADTKKKQAVANQNFELAASFRDRQTALERQLNERKAEWEKGEYGNVTEVTEEDVAEVVSLMTGVPVQRVAENESIRLRGMDKRLKENVIAQDKAIEKMVKAIQRNRIGLREPNHPIGVFMFLGPTGVGKTYLAKQLAVEMFGSDDALIRIDMSEYTESFNTSRLIGAPPGYVGYDEGGQLTERVRRRPYSIILLDEIEKAHQNVYNMLLQVLDEGRLTDGNGRLVDFRNTIIIMTSNAGTRQLKDFGRGVGFGASGNLGISKSESDKEHARSIIQKALSKQFAPEFLNRLDEIITFDQLDLQAIKKIVDIELTSLYKRVETLGYQLELTDDVKSFVAERGYDVQFGARPLKRAIQSYIEDVVCERMLSGELKLGDTIRMEKVEGKEELQCVVE